MEQEPPRSAFFYSHESHHMRNARQKRARLVPRFTRGSKFRQVTSCLGSNSLKLPRTRICLRDHRMNIPCPFHTALQRFPPRVHACAFAESLRVRVRSLWLLWIYDLKFDRTASILVGRSDWNTFLSNFVCLKYRGVPVGVQGGSRGRPGGPPGTLSGGVSF